MGSCRELHSFIGNWIFTEEFIRQWSFQKVAVIFLILIYARNLTIRYSTILIFIYRRCMTFKRSRSCFLISWKRIFISNSWAINWCYCELWDCYCCCCGTTCGLPWLCLWELANIFEGTPCPIEFPTEFCGMPEMFCIPEFWPTTFCMGVWFKLVTEDSVDGKLAELGTPDAMLVWIFWASSCWRVWDWLGANGTGSCCPWLCTWGCILWDAFDTPPLANHPH